LNVREVGDSRDFYDFFIQENRGAQFT